MALAPSQHKMRPRKSTVQKRKNTVFKGYTCRKCHHMFPYASDLHAHYRSHVSNRAYKCPYHGYPHQYKHLGFLNYHLMLHNCQEHKCLQCTAVFMNYDLYRSHLEKHTTVDRYQCENCLYKTKYCKTMIEHEKHTNYICK